MHLQSEESTRLPSATTTYTLGAILASQATFAHCLPPSQPLMVHIKACLTPRHHHLTPHIHGLQCKNPKVLQHNMKSPILTPTPCPHKPQALPILTPNGCVTYTNQGGLTYTLAQAIAMALGKTRVWHSVEVTLTSQFQSPTMSRVLFQPKP